MSARRGASLCCGARIACISPTSPALPTWCRRRCAPPIARRSPGPGSASSSPPACRSAPPARPTSCASPGSSGEVTPLSRTAGEGLSTLLLRGVFGGGVDHFTNFGDLGGWEAADLGVLPDNRLVLGEIDAEGLVGRDKALDPLDVGAELAQDAVRLRRGALQLLALEAADRRDVAIGDEFA